MKGLFGEFGQVVIVTTFESCKRCGRIFEDTLRMKVCPECVEKYGKDREFRAKLSLVRNYVKDQKLEGNLLTVKGVSEGTSLSEEEIWIFVKLGEISTTSFNDPKVREFIMRAAREREKLSKDDSDRIAKDIKRITGGYHYKRDK
jgi:predicted  nucleic acid-binding Zn-ribbon protein